MKHCAGSRGESAEQFHRKNYGKWRYIHTDQKGDVYAFHGVYHEVLAPELIINTFEFEGVPEKGHVCLETLRFEELLGERTRLTSQSIFQSVADRDSMLQSGMEGRHCRFDRTRMKSIDANTSWALLIGQCVCHEANGPF